MPASNNLDSNGFWFFFTWEGSKIAIECCTGDKQRNEARKTTGYHNCNYRSFPFQGSNHHHWKYTPQQTLDRIGGNPHNTH
ncbi:predicted protein [Lichtheimia corymbifera JMRC:FSU:9682]|uniref:Uncharacterized protein n=1 Tax=Lichtheimia corymbifera JMRC:FSU:9682 TaxID=1263082 RepID=A0A068RES5_9FUNG|nr:predicted protein [Lichtheimia corymbifera JMRC:FSU:9682]